MSKEAKGVKRVSPRESSWKIGDVTKCIIIEGEDDNMNVYVAKCIEGEEGCIAELKIDKIATPIVQFPDCVDVDGKSYKVVRLAVTDEYKKTSIEEVILPNSMEYVLAHVAMRRDICERLGDVEKLTVGDTTERVSSRREKICLEI